MLGDGSLGGGSELRRLKSSLFRARGAGQSLSILKGPIAQTPRQGRPRAAWTDGRDVSAATARGRCLPRLAWAQLGARPRWFGTEWTELVAHAKRYVDTCGWPATSSSACSGIRQLVRAPRRVSPLVGWLALRRATNGAGPTQVLRFGEGARPLRSLSVQPTSSCSPLVAGVPCA